MQHVIKIQGRRKMGSRDVMSQENARAVVDGAVVAGKTVRQQYFSGCGSESDRVDSETAVL